jgi:hypothetical protein
MEYFHELPRIAIEVQAVQGAIKVVKRFAIRFETVSVTFCRGWSVGGRRRKAIVFNLGCAV